MACGEGRGEMGGAACSVQVLFTVAMRAMNGRNGRHGIGTGTGTGSCIGMMITF